MRRIVTDDQRAAAKAETIDDVRRELREALEEIVRQGRTIGALRDEVERLARERDLSRDLSRGRPSNNGGMNP